MWWVYQIHSCVVGGPQLHLNVVGDCSPHGMNQVDPLEEERRVIVYIGWGGNSMTGEALLTSSSLYSIKRADIQSVISLNTYADRNKILLTLCAVVSCVILVPRR